MIFNLIDRRSEMILTTEVRPWLPRFTLISPNWLLICALTVFEIKIYFHFVIPCSKCPWYQYWCALQQYLMSILGITFPCQFRCSSWLAWFNLEISAIIMHLFQVLFTIPFLQVKREISFVFILTLTMRNNPYIRLICFHEYLWVWKKCWQ